jgi:predicted AlkP superfamily phosphohydrolase/phosphomutase/Flp pilus assembly protein TadD
MRLLRALSVVLVLGCGTGPQGGRVLVLALDGLDPQAVDLLMSEGRMPHFARLRQHGAYAPLRSMKPLLSPVVWTTIATGKTPDRHGIGHFVAVDEATGESLPASSEMRRVKALWNILSEAGRSVGVVGWWATWPPEEIDGWVVSDHTCYHFLFPQGAEGSAGGEEVTYPSGLRQRIAPLIRRPDDVTAEEAARFIDVAPEELAAEFDFENEVSHFRWALATAESYRDIGLELWREERPDALMVYVEATDSLAHLFGHLFRAEALSGELAEQQRRYGRAVEEIYLFADEVVGRYMEAMDDDTTLVVLSDHGFELGALQDDPSKTRDLRRVSERFHREDGVLYLYGRGVKRGRLESPTILDVAPTLLALAGVPAATDMPGRVLAEGLELPVPEPRVATWESPGAAAEGELAARDPAADAEMLRRLESLGYLGGDEASPGEPAGAPELSSPEGERNLAAILFEEGRYEESAAAFARLVEAAPDDAALRTSLAGALGALGRLEEALVQLDLAAQLDPLNVEAYHNRGVVLERLGEPQRAVEQYRTALRYDPQYAPSQRALLRLTGSAAAHVPASEAEARAMALAESAAEAARRGDYEGAMAQLTAAQQIAPDYSLVYQYRSNVAYLMGDLEAAADALRRALEIEPDNALFRTNLEKLEAQLSER